MARKLDVIVVVDLEATCWEGEPPDGQEGEIIEIGVCALDVGTLRRAERRSILVRPTRSAVSPYCTQLTTLTQEQVDGGIDFAAACDILRCEYRTGDRLWASYGDYDRRQFERQCAATAVSYPFGPGHLNVKTLFAVSHALSREMGMDAALAQLDHPLEGTHHRAGDDVWNIAAILASLLGAGRGRIAP